MKTRFYWMLALCMAGATAQATRIDAGAMPARPLPLRILSAPEAARLALENAVSVRSAALDLGLQSQQLEEVARGEFRPQATLGLHTRRAGSREDGSPAPLVNERSSTLTSAWKLRSGASLGVQAARSLAGAARTNSVTVGLTQPLLRGFGSAVATAALRTTETALDAARIDFEQTATEAVATALQAYFERRLAVLRVAIARDSVETAQRMHEVNRTLVDVGRSAASALLQSEADLAQSRLALAQAEQDESLARRALLVAIGAESAAMNSEVETPDGVEQYTNTAMPTLQEATDAALRSQPAMRSARENLKLAELQLLQAKDQMRLPLDLSIAAARTTARGASTGAAFPARMDASIGLATEIVLDRAPLRYAKSSAALGVRKAQIQLAETERTVRYAAADAVRQHEFVVQRLALARSAAQLSGRRLQMELEKQRLGRASALELSTVRREVAEAENQVAEAGYQVLRTQLEVGKVMGGLLGQWGLSDQVERWGHEIVR